MISTEYLFGFPRTKYEPCITDLATARVRDAKALLSELSHKKDYATDEELDALVERYIQVEKAKRFWEAILNEE